MISRIRINRFRGIREGSLEDLKQLTIMIGKNGAGKSTVLEGLYLVSVCAEDLDVVRRVYKLDYVVNRRGGRGAWDIDIDRKLLWYMSEYEQPIEIQIDIWGKVFRFLVLDLPKNEYPVRLVDKSGSLIELKKGLVWEGISAIPRIRGVSNELLEVKKFLEGILLIDALLMRRLAEVEVYAWPRLLTKRGDKYLIEMIKEEFEPDAEGLTYIPITERSNYLVLQTSKTSIKIDDLGDGAKSALVSAMLILAYKPTVVLIEEPELHMHPAGLYTYMRFLMRLSKEFSFQIIASTHSIEFVEIAQEISKDLGIDSTVLYLERDSNGVLAARKFSMDDYDILKKLGIDIRLLSKF